jgi:hypothetical protein
MAQHIQVGDLPRITEIARVLVKHGFGALVRCPTSVRRS